MQESHILRLRLIDRYRSFLDMSLNVLREEIRSCDLCKTRFAQTHTAHGPRPIVWFSGAPRITICGQAPGLRVHKSGVPFDDPSGDRLREWMGIDRAEFYDRNKIAIVPMAFCFPGYNAKGADLPPPPICARMWHNRLFQALPSSQLTLLVGGYAHRFHLQTTTNVTQTVADWRLYGPRAIPLPHPSWRNSGWLKKNHWFAQELLPTLRQSVSQALA